MAEQNNQQEKTEDATPKKLEDARKKGNVAKSQEINSVAILLTSFLFLYFAGSYMYDGIREYSITIFTNYGTTYLNPQNMQSYIELAILSFLKLVLPFLLSVMVAGILANLFQVGPLFSLEPITPKFSKINPLSGLKRVLFSKKSIVELIKNLFKIILIGYVATTTISGQLLSYRELMDKSAPELFQFITSFAFALSIKIVFLLLIIAIIDYIFQKKDYLHNLKMTKQDIKDEMKQSEGDPYLKARIRSIQREMSRRRMMDDVPDADVVITNPTELAIALKYTPGEMESPKVVAMGRRKIAEKIRDIAIEHNIPIVEDKPLAWALWRSVKVGDFVPEDLFQSVAEILAYVYKLKNKETVK